MAGDGDEEPGPLRDMVGPGVDELIATIDAAWATDDRARAARTPRARSRPRRPPS
ncbi:hypothetical protein R8Z50_18705 [Longispora sp. K20-0274]|uniref:hypothetical protein n=1 Tax=Longispora sp. K20-0274 TaxID=3088255 RepID=UPI00399B9DF2